MTWLVMLVALCVADEGIAIVPEDRVEKELADLQVGESTWAVPWAIAITDDRKCYLDVSFHQSDSPGGTVEMRVTRTKDGWTAEVDRKSNVKWSRSNCVVSIGGTRRELEPLRKLIFKEGLLDVR
jgi:hypothetical protein